MESPLDWFISRSLVYQRDKAMPGTVLMTIKSCAVSANESGFEYWFS
jgi:hypothetical protein